MNKKLKVLLIIVIAIVLVGGGAFLYITRPAAAPSADISSVTQQLPSGPTSSTASVYRISQTDSQAQYSVNETLHGSPFTAVGTTNQVAGDIQLDTANPSASQMGTIRVNARTFKTDSAARDGDVAHNILKTDAAANEFIDFKPTALKGMPTSITTGTAFTFEVDGDLTISGVTKPAVLKGSATLDATGKLSGTVTTTVKRSDYNLVIPNLSFVANVNDTVNVKATIVATRVESQ